LPIFRNRRDCCNGEKRDIAVPGLLYVNEIWTFKARDFRRITAAEMIYMRRTAGYTWTDYKTNAQIAKELKITPILTNYWSTRETGYNM